MRAWWDRGALSREKARQWWDRGSLAREKATVLGVLSLLPLSAGAAIGTWVVVIFRAKSHA